MLYPKDAVAMYDDYSAMLISSSSVQVWLL